MPNFAPRPEAGAAIEAFKLMQSDIAREKRLRHPEFFIKRLEALRTDDPEVFVALCYRLRTWLDGQA